MTSGNGPPRSGLGALRRVVLSLALLVGSPAFSAPGSAPATPPAAPPRPLDLADLAPPRFEAFTAKDGLSEEIWSSVGFDDRGFVWAGSASQLARFDGYTWKLWPFEDGRSLVRDFVRSEDGTLWTIFLREGLARLRNGRWELTGKRLASERFSILDLPDGSRQFWVDQDNTMHRLVGDRWIPDPGHDELPAGLSIKMARTETLFGEPREWLLRSPEQIWFRVAGDPPGPWQPYDIESLGLVEFSDMVASHDGGREELWILTYGHGFARLTNAGQRIWRQETDPLPSTAILSSVATHSPDGQRTLWIGSRGGLIRLRDDRLQLYDRSDGLPSDAVRTLKVQSDPPEGDVLWVATEGGIARVHLKPSAWRTVSRLGASENGTFGVLVEPDGKGGERLFVGSAKDGLALLADGAWRRLTTETSDLTSNGIHRLWRLTDEDGTLLRLASLVDGSVVRIHDSLAIEPFDMPWSSDDWTPPAATDRTAGGHVLASSALSRSTDQGHELWIGTRYRGLFRRDHSGWQQIVAPALGETLGVVHLRQQIDQQGRSWIWAASERGVARVDASGLHWLAVSRQATESGYRHLALVRRESRDELWASTNRHGVIRFDVSDPESVTLLDSEELPAPPDPTVYSVHEDSIGRLYLCTNNGVQQLTPTESGGFTERVFRRRDGLIHDECNTGGQLVDDHDRYWVGTLGGLSVYDPSLENPSKEVRPDPLRVTDVRLDGESLGTRYRIEVPAGTREIQVGFVVLSNQRENESRYRTQLVGFEDAPTQWSRQPGRFFGNLPPGTYDLVLEGRNYAGIASPRVTLSLVVAPKWWQRSLIQVTGGLTSLGMLFGLGMLNTRRLRRRQQELETVVATRTEALHAANERLKVLSNHDPLTGLANRRSLTEQAERILATARARQDPVGLIVLDIDRFKSFNDRFGHLAGDEALRAVARILEQSIRNGDLVARFGGEEFACLLPDADGAVSHRIAELLRTEVEQQSAAGFGAGTEGVTISAGVVARVPTAETVLSQLLEAADQALYRAKREGRNRVVLSRSEAADART